MTTWQRWVQRPQALRARKIVFQIHMWAGVAIALYVLVVGVSGSALVLRHEIGIQSRKPVSVAAQGRPRMALAELERIAEQTYLRDEVLTVIDPQTADLPVTVILQHGNTRVRRLLDPYTGADLGDPRPMLDRVLSWLADLHDNLLSGLTGRTVNGGGAFVLTLLAFTGAVIWWPGAANWKRSLTVNRKARLARLNWGLHSAAGFWCYVFVLIWGISGICLCFPGAFDPVLGAEFRLWITRLHFGRFNGFTEGLWTLLGLAPALLAITGALMWWNRVLNKKLRRPRKNTSSADLSAVGRD